MLCATTGICDLRDLGVAVFWPMTAALFGKGASKENHPGLYVDFDQIDTYFPKVRLFTACSPLLHGLSTQRGLHDLKVPAAT